MWFAVLSSDEVRRSPVGVRRLGRDLVFWRDSLGKVHALEDFCVHRRARLSAGKVINDRIQCPFHGFEYDGNGRVRLIPALGKNYEVPDRFRVNSYPVYEKNNIIWLWFGEESQRRSQSSSMI